MNADKRVSVCPECILPNKEHDFALPSKIVNGQLKKALLKKPMALAAGSNENKTALKQESSLDEIPVSEAELLQEVTDLEEVELQQRQKLDKLGEQVSQ